MKRNIKSVFQKLVLLTLAAVLVMTSVCAADDVPYVTYNYDYWENVVYTPAAYIPDGKIEGTSIKDDEGNSIGAFSGPEDVYLAADGNIYIADTKNNRIVVISSEDYSFVAVITGFTDENGVWSDLKEPQGVCHSEAPDGNLYIADTGNNRVVILNKDYELVHVIQNPEQGDNVLEDGFIFAPMKVIVDYAERIYVIAKNTEEGIMIFNTDYQFEAFYGQIPVVVTTWQRIWYHLSTREQKDKQTLRISTEYNGLDVDPNGFIYASYLDENGLQAVMRLNPKGNDVIKKGVNANIGGDIDIVETNAYSGKSTAVDVVYRDNGIYSFLDSKRGRIFTYDHEGNLLYIFGGLGSQEGCFQAPSSIEQNTNGQIMVADRNQNIILLFKPTEYGSLINEAVGLRFDGNEELAVPLWEEVLKLDANFELAYIGLGKSYLSAGENKKAMEYLENGMSRQYYSIAYRRYRNEFLVENLEWMLTALVVLIVAVVVVKKIRNRKQYRDDSADTLE